MREQTYRHGMHVFPSTVLFTKLPAVMLSVSNTTLIEDLRHGLLRKLKQTQRNSKAGELISVGC